MLEKQPLKVSLLRGFLYVVAVPCVMAAFALLTKEAFQTSGLEQLLNFVAYMAFAMWGGLLTMIVFPPVHTPPEEVNLFSQVGDVGGQFFEWIRWTAYVPSACFLVLWNLYPEKPVYEARFTLCIVILAAVLIIYNASSENPTDIITVISSFLKRYQVVNEPAVTVSEQQTENTVE